MHWNCNRPEFSRLEVIKALVPYFLSCLRNKAQRLTQQHLFYCLLPREIKTSVKYHIAVHHLLPYHNDPAMKHTQNLCTSPRNPQENNTRCWENHKLSKHIANLVLDDIHLPLLEAFFIKVSRNHVICEGGKGIIFREGTFSSCLSKQLPCSDVRIVHKIQEPICWEQEAKTKKKQHAEQSGQHTSFILMNMIIV